jgi:aerobic C4-dicarboxylate transport protein
VNSVPSVTSGFGGKLSPASAVPTRSATSPFSRLYVQVLIGIAAGVLLGAIAPETAAAMRPLGDGFIKLIKMMIAPIVFCTVVAGIGKMADMKGVGSIGLKALIYFEVVSTAALLIGLVVGLVVRPGSGIHATAATLDPQAVKSYVAESQSLHLTDFLLNVIPTTIAQAFAGGDILQILLVAVLFGLAIMQVGKPAAPLLHVIDQLGAVLFAMVGLIVRVAPIGAFGAMAFTIGRYGVGTLFSLAKLMAAVYLTCFLFVVIVLGAVAALCGFSLWKFIRFIKEEILLVLGTSSSESALPRMMAKLEYLGCDQSVVGLVIPTGYSFNLDGTSIYMTIAVAFVAQALDVQLGWREYLTLVGVLMLTSKGAAAVTGGGFITLAATLASTSTLPVAGLTLLIGVDRFMSEARAITNLIGNGVATMVVARWEGALDLPRALRILETGRVPEGALTEPAKRAG